MISMNVQYGYDETTGSIHHFMNHRKQGRNTQQYNTFCTRVVGRSQSACYDTVDRRVPVPSTNRDWLHAHMIGWAGGA